MKFATIHRPSKSTLSLLKRKIYDEEMRDVLTCESVESVGICQGTVVEIIVASDIAEKTSNVLAGEINGSCPQHMTCLAVVGSTAAVMAAIEAIKGRLESN
ncbi:MAG: BMC domain protein [Emergencia sp.]|nr:BMC domain protein [Emergencia sp.]